MTQDDDIQIHSLTIRDGDSGEVLCEHSWNESPDQDSHQFGTAYTTYELSRSHIEILLLLRLDLKSILSTPTHTNIHTFRSLFFFSVDIPVRVLNCRAVSRELVFHSKKKLNKLSTVQRVMMQQSISVHDSGDRESTRSGTKSICIEEWVFTFGFVIPGSINTWQTVVTSAEEQDKTKSSTDMKGVEFVIETSFFDDKSFICKKNVLVRYV